MSIDGYFIYNLINELSDSLKNNRLEKINYNGVSDFTFSFYHDKKRKNLKVSFDSKNFGMYITNKELENNVSNQFLMILKKHLEGSILESIHQYQHDRVIIMDFIINDFLDGVIKKTLVFELMGRHSNFFLIKDGVIIDCYKKMFNVNGRQLLPNAKFHFFENDNKLSFLSIDYSDILASTDLVKTYQGVSPLLANYLFNTKEQLSNIKINPTKNLDNNKFYVVDLFDTTNKTHYETISLLLDNLDKADTINENDLVKNFIDKQVKKNNKKLDNLAEQLKSANIDLNYKDKADSLYSKNLDLKSKISLVDDIVLDGDKTINENAQIFYAKYQKAKRAIEHTNLQIKETNDLINMFEEQLFFLGIKDKFSILEIEEELKTYGYKSKKKTIVQKKKKNSTINKVIVDDVTIIYGKNNIQNAIITHEIASKGDYWFHVKDAPGSHIVVQNTNPTENVIRKAAMLAAHFSKLKNSSSIPVDYTLIKNIKKINGLPGYNVSYKSNKTIFIDIDQKEIEKLLHSN